MNGVATLRVVAPQRILLDRQPARKAVVKRIPAPFPAGMLHADAHRPRAKTPRGKQRSEQPRSACPRVDTLTQARSPEPQAPAAALSPPTRADPRAPSPTPAPASLPRSKHAVISYAKPRGTPDPNTTTLSSSGQAQPTCPYPTTSSSGQAQPISPHPTHSSSGQVQPTLLNLPGDIRKQVQTATPSSVLKATLSISGQAQPTPHASALDSQGRVIPTTKLLRAPTTQPRICPFCGRIEPWPTRSEACSHCARDVCSFWCKLQHERRCPLRTPPPNPVTYISIAGHGQTACPPTRGQASTGTLQAIWT